MADASNATELEQSPVSDEENLDSFFDTQDGLEDSGGVEVQRDSQKRGQQKSTFKGVLAKTMPVNFKIGEDEDTARSIERKETDSFHLQEDIFTLLFICPYFTSQAFWYATFFFLFQATLIALMTKDLLKDGTSDNFLAVPAGVDKVVSVSQVFALFIAVLTQDDVTTTLYLVSVGYDSDQVPPTASRAKWIISNTLRFLLGMVIIFVCFIFIVQSDEVIELFKDFAAVVFVAEIDDVAFALARRGFMTKSIQDMTKGLDEIEFAERDDTLHVSTRGPKYLCCSRTPTVAFRFRQIFLWVVFGAMVGAWGYIYSRQKAGDFMTKSFQLQLGDETFGDLHYAYFSGVYELKSGERIAGRPVYYERGDISEQSSGKIFYCEDEGAWVFAIDGITKNQNRDDECHWLVRSPDSTKYDLSESKLDNWRAWTGTKIETMNHFEIHVAECSQDSDCNYHGACRQSDGVCDCDPGWLGEFCNFEDNLCDELGLFVKDKLIGKYSVLTNDNDQAVVVYDRPVFFHQNKSDGSIDALLYTGRRWFLAGWDGIKAVGDFLSLVSDPMFHAYWSRIYDNNALAFSEPTDSMMPVGSGVVWDLIGSFRARGDFGSFGFHADLLHTSIHCMRVDCSVHFICGLAGQCLNGTCVCEEGVSGHFCQFPFHAALGDDRNLTILRGDEL